MARVKFRQWDYWNGENHEYTGNLEIIPRIGESVCVQRAVGEATITGRVTQITHTYTLHKDIDIVIDVED